MAAMPHAAVNGIELCYESFGDDADPTLLLVSGLGSQMISWYEPFCEALAGRGLRVVRFDNRDTGGSTRFGAAGTPNVRGAMGGGDVEVPTWPTTPPGCSTTWVPSGRTSRAPRWAA